MAKFHISYKWKAKLASKKDWKQQCKSCNNTNEMVEREHKGRWPAVSILCSDDMLGKCQKQVADRIFILLKLASFLERLYCAEQGYFSFTPESRSILKNFLCLWQKALLICPILLDVIWVLQHWILSRWDKGVHNLGQRFPHAFAAVQPSLAEQALSHLLLTTCPEGSWHRAPQWHMVK